MNDEEKEKDEKEEEIIHKVYLCALLACTTDDMSHFIHNAKMQEIE